MSRACARNDLVERDLSWLLWRLPMLGFLIGVLVTPPVRLLLWLPAFLVAGVACIVNARRCGRFHCFLTGPLYLLAAVATAAGAPWPRIACGVVVGTIAAYAVEFGYGKYRTVT